MAADMLHEVLRAEDIAFTTHARAKRAMAGVCVDHPEVARFEEIGESEGGRPLYAVVVGRGPQRVSLVAGAHAEEPVGVETLRRLGTGLVEHRDALAEVLDRFTFVIVPHVNPDGEKANRAWLERWPDALAFLQYAVREPPGRDVEFGYPDMRPENRAVAGLLREEGPFDLHMSLHGMAVSEGAWLLIDREWVGRTGKLRLAWLDAIAEAGLPPFDWNRGGEKGFEYVGPGFSTTPRGAAMREHFEAAGDADTAGLFHDSSMEYVRKLGGDPLCLVTELPLFVLRGTVGAVRPGVPTAFLRFREKLPRWRAMVESGRLSELLPEVQPLEPEPLSLDTAVGLHLRLLDIALETVWKE